MRGLYAGAVIKKRRYWPSYIQGMCYYFIIYFSIAIVFIVSKILLMLLKTLFVLTQNFVMIMKLKRLMFYMERLMSYSMISSVWKKKIIMWGSSPNCQRMKARRTIANGDKVELEYIEPIAHHFDYRHCVDDNNHLHIWGNPLKKHVEHINGFFVYLLAFFFAVPESMHLANAFLCFWH